MQWLIRTDLTDRQTLIRLCGVDFFLQRGGIVIQIANLHECDVKVFAVFERGNHARGRKFCNFALIGLVQQSCLIDI